MSDVELDHSSQIVLGSAGTEAICACGWRSFAMPTRQEAVDLAAVHVQRIDADARLRDLDARLRDLATRLVASGPKAAHVSASECHEISEGVYDLLDEVARLRALHEPP